MKRRDKFDHIMIETTGMADPGPVAQTFFMDDELREALSLDGVVTMVDAKHVLLHSEVALDPGAAIAPGEQLSQISLEGEQLYYILRVPSAGPYVLFTEHHLDEFEAFVSDAQGTRIDSLLVREYKPDHEHDEEVTSVGINTPGDLDLRKFQTWLSDLLANQGPDIFRMKGVLSFQGAKARYVFQGVHMLFDGRMDRPWRDGEKANSLIFIGRNLNREALNAGFESCLT